MHILLTPGPVAVPPNIMAAISQAVIHHRTPAFASLYEQILSGFRYLFQTQHTVGTMIGSGTYGVSAAIYSLFRPGEKILIVNNGKFSERWAAYSRLCELEVEEIQKEWGQVAGVKEIITQIKQNPRTSGIILTHCETSTGACLDLEEIAFAIKRKYPHVLILVDAITTAGAIPFYMDEWQLDCAIVASQKALMNPAGTIAFALSEQAKQKLKPSQHADFRNLYNYVEAAKKNQYPYTAPVQLLYGIHEALKQIQQQGLPARWNQIHATAKAFRDEIVKIGGEIFTQAPSDSLTAFYFPSLDHEKCKRKLLNEHQIELAGGQGDLKGRILRVSHMGETDPQLMRKVVEKLASVKLSL